LPEDEAMQRLMRRPLVARTARTVTELAVVMERLTAVRAQGFSVNDEEVELGLRSIAVPVLTARGVTVAALNLGLPVRGEDVAGLPARYLPALLQVQAELRQVLR
jgi:IclR family pca regulon transcriptional regulator